MSNNSNAKIMFIYIIDLKPKFNDFENNFMKSVGERLSLGKEISFKQYSCLERVYAKYTGGSDYERRERIWK